MQALGQVRLAVGVGAVMFGLASLDLPLAHLVPPNVYHNKDFLQDYLLGRAVLDGVDPYLPLQVLSVRYITDVPDLGGNLPTPHPPTLALLFAPVWLLPYRAAAIAWLVLEVISLAAAVHLLGRMAGGRPGISLTAAVTAMTLGWYPIRSDLSTGQVMVPLLCLLAALGFAVRADHRLLAGLLLGLTLLIKPILWPLVLLFVLRRDRAVSAAAIGTALLGYTMAGFVIGPDRLAAYFSQVLPSVTDYYQSDPLNLSFWTLDRRAFGGLGPGHASGVSVLPLIGAEPLALPPLFALPACALLIVVAWARECRELAGPLAVTVCVSLLVSPVVWPSYLVLAAVPIAQTVAGLRQRCWLRRETSVALVAAGLLLPNWVGLAYMGAVLTPVTNGVPTFPTVLGLLLIAPTVAVGLLGWLCGWMLPPAGGAQRSCPDARDARLPHVEAARCVAVAGNNS